MSDVVGTAMGLVVTNVSKTFGATKALDDVSFTVARGKIHGLLGGNGSGKSTLIKLLAGIYSADSGEFEVNGNVVAADSVTPAVARSVGLRFVHQNPAVFPELTVAENMAIGHGYEGNALGIDWRRQRKLTQGLLERFGIDANAGVKLEELSQSEQTMVAVARALQDVSASGDPSVLVLDEPTASLPPQEASLLLQAIRELANAGQTIILVTHRIDEVLAVTDRVTVLRDGKLVATLEREGLTEPVLVETIIGRAPERVFAENIDRSAERTGAPALELKGLEGGPLVDVGLRVYPGEIVGIAGLLGSGRTELLEMVFGMRPHTAGDILLDGSTVSFQRSGQAMKNGIALIPENRELDGVFLDQSVRFNFTIASVRRYWKRGWFSRVREARGLTDAIAQFSIKLSSQDADISSLSGGNAQKVVVSRWLSRDPKVLLLDEPTQGVDVGARADIHKAIREAVSNGMAALFVSSDMDELAHACDRVLVLRDGRIINEFFHEQMSADILIEATYLTA
jgi:ribose transport system ATP-binding protein